MRVLEWHEAGGEEEVRGLGAHAGERRSLALHVARAAPGLGSGTPRPAMPWQLAQLPA